MPANGSTNRRLAAILFADIVGYTAMMQSDEGEAVSRLSRYQSVLASKVASYNGELVKNYGDGSLSLFSSVLDAVQCAKAIQIELREEPKVPLRIGIHLGDVMYRDDDIYGNAVNIASRIESMGVAGSVLMSKGIFEKVKNQSSLSFEALGDFHFKNVSEEISLFALSNDDFVVPKLTSPTKPKKSLLYYVGVPLFIVVFAIFSYLSGWIGPSSKSRTMDERIEQSIAVLPLLNLNSKNENLEYFSDGVTQEIIDELVKVNSFRVSAFSSTILFKASSESPSEIAKHLDVNYLIRGSARTLEDSVKLSVNLIDPISEKIIWNEVYVSHIEDAPRIQGKIARSVAQKMDIQLTADELKSLGSLNTDNGQAFKLFLQAKSEVNNFSKSGFEKAISHLNSAIELDSNYAQAYTLLAWSYLLIGDPTIVPNAVASEETIQRVEPLLKRSIQLAPNNSDTYLVRSALNIYAKNDVNSGIVDVERALALNSWPRVPTNYCLCTIITAYVASRELDKAVEAAQLSSEIDPGNILISWDKGNVEMAKGNYKLAREQYLQAAESHDIFYFNTYAGWGFYHEGSYREAIEYLSKAEEQSVKPLLMTEAYLSNTYYKLNDAKQSEQYLESLLLRATQGEPHVNLFLAMTYAARGQKPQTLSYLEKAITANEYSIAIMLNLDPSFDFLRNDAEFINLTKDFLI